MESSGMETKLREDARYPVRNPGIAGLIQRLGIIARSITIPRKHPQNTATGPHRQFE